MKHRSDTKDVSSGAKGERKLHSVSQEAERLGISKGWLYSEIRAGRFPHEKLGNRILLNPADVDDFKAQQKVSIADALQRVAEDKRRW